jgi:Glycosyl hydrolases family 16
VSSVAFCRPLFVSFLRTKLRAPALGAFIALILTLGVACTAHAATLTLSPVSGPTGTSVSASGTGFGNRLDGTLTLGTNQVATFRTRSNRGRFRKSFTVPGGYSGPTTVTARTSAASATASFNVTGGSPPPPPPTDPQPVGGPGGSWSLEFRDEFNGGTLDPSKWRPNWFGWTDQEVTSHHGISCADPANLQVGGGVLNLSVERTACTASRTGESFPYRGALISSNPYPWARDGRGYEFTYGYQEARLRLPSSNGLWPAWWSAGQTWPDDGEIDTLERTHDEVAEYHYHSPCPTVGGGVTIPGASTGYHTYATYWAPGLIVWYYDGREVFRTTQCVTNSLHYLILQHTVQAGTSPAGGVLSADYVRVWQR